MILRRLLLAIVALCLSVPVGGAAGFVSSIGSQQGPISPSQGTRWSTLGVVDDGVTDNTAALNALPANTTIIGDCPNGGTIRVNSNWIWKSNWTIYVDPGCWIVNHGGTGLGFITNSDLTVPVDNISIIGLNLTSVVTTPARAFNLYANDLTLTNFQVTGFPAFAFLRGSNQELGYFTAIGSAPETGNPGLRHMGNVPKVATTGGKPANVWVHDCTIVSGDAALQVDPALTGPSPWSNVSADDYVYEKCTAFGRRAPAILIGGVDATDCSVVANWAVSNIVVRNISAQTADDGVHPTTDVKVQNGRNAQHVSNITLADITIDSSLHTVGGAGSISILSNDQCPTQSLGGKVKTVAVDRVSVKNPLQRSVVVFGDAQDTTVDFAVLDPPRTASFPNVYVATSLRTTISNSQIGTTGNGIGVGPQTGILAPAPSVSTSIVGNTITNVVNNRTGIQLLNAAAATVTGNTITSKAGATRSTGISLISADSVNPGTTNSTVTGNTVTGLSTPVVCASGQGNTVTGNAGASDCPP